MTLAINSFICLLCCWSAVTLSWPTWTEQLWGSILEVKLHPRLYISNRSCLHSMSSQVELVKNPPCSQRKAKTLDMKDDVTTMMMIESWMQYFLFLLREMKGKLVYCRVPRAFKKQCRVQSSPCLWYQNNWTADSLSSFLIIIIFHHQFQNLPALRRCSQTKP